jgi:prepilin-type N-terminal cleavage/methylation domain-containing protein
MQATSATGIKQRRGFTLIELSIVVFIMAILMAVSLPFFVRSFNSASVSEMARKFVTACQFARLQAVLRHDRATMHIDLDRQTIWITQNVHTEDGDMPDQQLRIIEVPNRVFLLAAQQAEESIVRHGQVDIIFYPNGTCDGGALLINGVNKGDALTVMIDPVTGRGATTLTKQ